MAAGGYYFPLEVIGGNTVTVTNCNVTTAVGSGIVLQNGTNNQVLQSTITGGYDGGSTDVGADDGIVLEYETGDTIQGNTISNVYDAGIEGADTVANTTLASNTITNVGAAGIGTYWCTSWTNNMIRLNNVSRAPVMFDATYSNDPGKCGPSGPAANFTGNSFIGNRVRSPAQGTFPSIFSQGMYVFLSAGTPVSGNLIQGNDFGTQECPTLSPPQGFIDGGGNICAASAGLASAGLRRGRKALPGRVEGSWGRPDGRELQVSNVLALIGDFATRAGLKSAILRLTGENHAICRVLRPRAASC